jgi:ABC-2 type transport system ATP-binding protein
VSPAIAVAIAIEGVTRRFGAHLALDGLSFSVPAGGVFGLLGPNGAGKTTLLSAIAGFISIHGGIIRLLGLDHRDPSLRGRFGILPQDAAFQSDLPILDQL